jgi:hypothetical protein
MMAGQRAYREIREEERDREAAHSISMRGKMGRKDFLMRLYGAAACLPPDTPLPFHPPILERIS